MNSTRMTLTSIVVALVVLTACGGGPEGSGGRVHPYDLDAGALGEPLPTIGGGDPFPVLVGSPDGSWLVVAARSNPADGPTTVGVVETATGALAFPPTVVDGAVTSIAFLPQRVASPAATSRARSGPRTSAISPPTARRARPSGAVR